MCTVGERGCPGQLQALGRLVDAVLRPPLAEVEEATQPRPRRGRRPRLEGTVLLAGGEHDALEMARWSRGTELEGLVCHSGAGSQVHVSAVRRTAGGARRAALDRLGRGQRSVNALAGREEPVTPLAGQILRCRGCASTGVPSSVACRAATPSHEVQVSVSASWRLAGMSRWAWRTRKTSRWFVRSR